VDANVGRNPVRRTEMAVLSSGGLKAVTNWKVEERFQYGAVVKLSLETGRTHQIRVHMEYLKSPVIGDTTYGSFDMLPQNLVRASNAFNRQALHAETLGFIHPITGEALKFSSPMPQDMSALIETFRSFV
jgi:23S rRNA pseudouridine1911/1915/1917 synthase